MKKKYTLIIIPPDHAPTKQFQLSIRGKRLLATGILVFGGIIGSLLIHDFLQIRYINKYKADFAEVDQLKAALVQKDQEIAELDNENDKITSNLNEITNLEKKIASILKIQPPTISSSSRGVKAQPQSFTTSSEAKSNLKLVESHLEAFKELHNASLKYQDEIDHTPTILPALGEIASPFGYRKNPFGGWSSEFHNGVDIACDYGTPVLATADGVVTFANWDRVYGRKVDIDHGNGIITFYGHNSRLIVKQGDTVKKGDLIAYSGNTGRSTGAHLHYGAFVDGKSVDPLMFTNFTKEQ